MTQTLLSQDQLQDFERRGVLRLEGLLSPEGVRAAREALLRPLEKLGLWQDGGWKLDAVPRPKWPASGPKTASAIGHKHPELKALAQEPKVQALIGELLEGLKADSAQGPQVLFTLPNSDTWFVPHGWHPELPRLKRGGRPGIQIFAFLDPVAPASGGTMTIAGSHLLLNDGRCHRAQDVQRLLRPQPFFRDLYLDPDHRPPECADLMDRKGRIDGVELGLIEMTGEPGDAYVTDLRTLHSGAPNASDRPRLMMTQRFIRTDLAAELAEAYGWS